MIIKNINRLLGAARQNKIDIIYIRHDGGLGDELERDTKGWEIYHAIAPMPNERIFDKKFNSAFRETGLQEYLDKKGIKTIILSGMQTEYCIDTTCKVAFEFGYNIVVPEDTTTTFDNNSLTGETLAKYYEQKIWRDRFAKVLTVDDTINEYISR